MPLITDQKIIFVTDPDFAIMKALLSHPFHRGVWRRDGSTT